MRFLTRIDESIATDTEMINMTEFFNKDFKAELQL